MRTYELSYIIGDAVADDKTSEVMSEVTKELERLGAVIIKEEAWGKRKLAYPIKKSAFGTYVTLQTHLEGNKVGEIERFLRLHSTVIRHILLGVVPQSIKTTDEQELAQALEKRVEEKITKKEQVDEPKDTPAETEEQEIATPSTSLEKVVEEPKKRRTRTKASNEEEKKEESEAERKKLVEEKLSEILGEE